LSTFVGIDLGSTTTKAVLLDTDGQVVGRGITNSRSNYEVACSVAREEALTAARFTLLARALTGGSDTEDIARVPFSYTGQYLKKGRQVYVEGRIRTNKWQDKDGNERYTTEIIGNEMKMLGSREGMGSPSASEGEYGGSMPSASAAGSGRQAPAKKTPSFEDMDDDIPF